MGELIVITGINGCGKSTQIINLLDLLQKNGIDSISMKITKLEDMAEDLLKLKYKTIYQYFDFQKKDSNLHFLNVCISMYSKMEYFIWPQLNNYDYVILDRYLESIFGIAEEYNHGMEIAEIVFKQARKPDKAILLDISTEEAMKRIEKRYETEQRSIGNLNPELLKHMDFYYKNKFKFYDLHIVNGEENRKEVTNQLIQYILYKN